MYSMRRYPPSAFDAARFLELPRDLGPLHRIAQHRHGGKQLPHLRREENALIVERVARALRVDGDDRRRDRQGEDAGAHGLGEDIPDLPAAVGLLKDFGVRQGFHEMARDLLGARGDGDRSCAVLKGNGVGGSIMEFARRPFQDFAGDQDWTSPSR